MSVKIEKICEPVWLGEGPHWCADTKCLFFVDILSKTIHRYNPSTRKTNSAQLDSQVSLIVPVLGGKDEFVVTQGRRLVRINWDGVSSKATHQEVLAEEPIGSNKKENSFNDGKADPTGRLWAGTMHLGKAADGSMESSPGSVYSWSRDKGLVQHATDIGIPNGLAWSHDSKTLYYIDSVQLRIDAFDCDINKPALSNRRPVFDLKANDIEGLPDGMTIDANGNLWVAVFRAAKLLNIDPRTGKLLRTVTMPVLQPTSVAFGGSNLDELYVTSANYEMTEEEKKMYPDAGATFKITGLGVKGLAGVAAKL